MKRRHILLAAVAAAVLVAACAECLAWPGSRRRGGADDLPGVTVAMQHPAFWIERVPYPDETILGPDEIAALNRSTEKDLGLLTDIAALGPSYPGADLTAVLAQSLVDIRKRGLVYLDGTVPGDDLYRAVEAVMDLGSVPETVEVRYAVTVMPADLRILPADGGLYKKAGDGAFDRLQESGLDIGTGLAVLHPSADGRWLYVRSRLSAGWIRTASVAFCASGELQRYLGAQDAAVVTNARAWVWFDEGLTRPAAVVRMGTRFPVLAATESGTVRIKIPSRERDGRVAWRDGYVRAGDVNRGFLPYTARTVIEQAFRLFGAPYGWGDARGAQDCSRFIQEVFATVGVEMPRNSAGQDRVGVLLDSLGKAESGITTLKLDGHIMLYLGAVDGTAYAIHALWGYAVPGKGGDSTRIVSRVVVSDLSLGEGTAKGPLSARITTVRKVALPEG